MEKVDLCQMLATELNSDCSSHVVFRCLSQVLCSFQNLQFWSSLLMTSCVKTKAVAFTAVQDLTDWQTDRQQSWVDGLVQ